MIRRARRPRKAPERFDVCNPGVSTVKAVKGVTKRTKAPVKKRLKALPVKRSKQRTAAVKKKALPRVAKKSKAQRTRASKKDCEKLVGQCIRIDWPVRNSPEEGEYTAMVFSYNHRSKKHKLFYYATAESEESFEELDLYDGGRNWNVEPNPAMRHPLPGENARSPDPRNLIGRRVWVAWPDEATGKPKSYDAVVVDYVRATEFRIVYVDDEWVENRDLVSSELAWELYDPPGDGSESDKGQQVSTGPRAENRSALGVSSLDHETCSAGGTVSGRAPVEAASVSAHGIPPPASSSATVAPGLIPPVFQANAGMRANLGLEADVPPAPLPSHLYSTGMQAGAVAGRSYAVSDDPPPLVAAPHPSHGLLPTPAAVSSGQVPPQSNA